ncbi:MAG: TRAP transporter large permease [Syntrophobacteraceae bacterium]|nr:TRAP transporter large permease [Syntrophobacteraceae bacterium]HOV87065.1 TRAP transporter large permease [Syntrophobacteraceae bacterium]
MDEGTLLWLITGLTAVFFVVGVPIFLCIGVWTTLASLAIGFTISNIGITSYQGISSYALLAMPLFILTGDLIGAGGIAVKLSALAAAILRPIRGGMALATIMTCSTFAAISGSNSATVATIGRIMIPEMQKQGYNPAFAAANAASGGIVGILIPPSVLMVIYGFMTNLSVIDLFTAGWGPGLCVSLGLAGAALFSARKNKWGEVGPFVFKDVFKAFWGAKFGILAVFLILFLIYGGYSSPTESAGVVAFYCLLAGMFLTRELKLRDIPEVFLSSGRVNGMLAPVIAISIVLQQVFNIIGLHEGVYDLIHTFKAPSLMLLAMMAAIVFFGCIMESISVCIILSPIFAPIAVSMGMNPYHFALTFIVGLSLGFVTPPFGLDLFVASGITGIPYGKIIKWIPPFLVGICLAWLAVAFIPAISLTLFKIVGGGGAAASSGF